MGKTYASPWMDLDIQVRDQVSILKEKYFSDAAMTFYLGELSWPGGLGEGQYLAKEGWGIPNESSSEGWGSLEGSG